MCFIFCVKLLSFQFWNATSLGGDGVKSWIEYSWLSDSMLFRISWLFLFPLLWYLVWIRSLYCKHILFDWPINWFVLQRSSTRWSYYTSEVISLHGAAVCHQPLEVILRPVERTNLSEEEIPTENFSRHYTSWGSVRRTIAWIPVDLTKIWREICHRFWRNCRLKHRRRRSFYFTKFWNHSTLNLPVRF